MSVSVGCFSVSMLACRRRINKKCLAAFLLIGMQSPYFNQCADFPVDVVYLFSVFLAKSVLLSFFASHIRSCLFPGAEIK